MWFVSITKSKDYEKHQTTANKPAPPSVEGVLQYSEPTRRARQPAFPCAWLTRDPDPLYWRAFGPLQD
jgi:hypothetical protein